MRAIDRLKQAANLKPMKKVIPLSDGTDFVLYHAPLTMAERERAQKDAKSDDAGAFALQLIVQCAKDENGERMFNVGDIIELKMAVRDEDVQKIIGAILSNEPDEVPTTAEAKSAGVGKTA